MYNVNAYSLLSDGDVKIGKWFKAREFKCYDGSDLILVSPELVILLDSLRDNMRCPIYVNSGYRSHAHNIKVGGAKKSMHLYGCAADIRPKDGNLEKLHKLAEEHLKCYGGLGKYKTFIHVDIRTKKSRWNG